MYADETICAQRKEPLKFCVLASSSPSTRRRSGALFFILFPHHDFGVPRVCPPSTGVPHAQISMSVPHEPEENLNLNFDSVPQHFETCSCGPGTLQVHTRLFGGLRRHAERRGPKMNDH